MDEKERENIPERVDQPEETSGARPENAPPETTEAQPEAAWQFDAKVETDLSNLDLSYSGKEIEIVAPLMKEQPEKDDDTITISKTKMRKTVKKIGIAVGAVVAVCLVVLGVVYGFFVPNSMEFMSPANTALTIDGTKVSVGAYNYYYNSFTGESYLTNYEAMGLDTTLPYEEQYYDESTGQTWAEFFEENAVDQLRFTIYYYNQAKDLGLKLSEEEEAQLDEAMEQLETTALTSGKSVNAYLQETYGDYVGVNTIRKMQEIRYLAQVYLQAASAVKRVTPEEVEAYREEHPEALESAGFRYIALPYTQEEKEKVRASSAELQSKLTTPDAFVETVKPYVDESYRDYITDEYTSISGVTATNEQVPGEIREWLFNSGLQVNDTTVIDSEDDACFYVLMLTETPTFAEDMLFSSRHLLVKVESGTDDDGNALEPTEEQWAACKKKAEEYLNQFNQTDKSEFAFAQLADEYSADTSSTSAGGSYGGLIAQQSTGALVPAYEEWCLDSSRKYGDVGLVQTDYGYHLIFFISNQEAWKYTAESAILAQREDEGVEKVECKENLGFKKRSVAQPVTEDATEE